MEMSREGRSSRGAGFWSRFRGRLRFGLATQEVLDRLARLGVVCYPYYIVEEPVVPRPEAEAVGRGLDVRALGFDDAASLARLAAQPRDESRLRELMSVATCVAVFENDEMLAYTWFRRDHLKAIGNVGALCDLPPGWAYLFDLYVRPDQRGRKLAVFVRHRVHSLLAEQGVTRCCSISLAFNRSTRRLKAKLGAVETELRLLLRLSPWRGVDVRLRRRRPGPLATPALRAVHAHARSADQRSS